MIIKHYCCAQHCTNEASFKNWYCYECRSSLPLELWKKMREAVWKRRHRFDPHSTFFKEAIIACNRFLRREECEI